MKRETVERMWAFEPATFVSPRHRQAFGDAAPRLPFPVYLVEHADGLVLFDTGLDPNGVGKPAAVYGEIAERIEIDFREPHLIETQLDQLGYRYEDVTTVVASHLHFDHAGGLRLFPHARTYLGYGEMGYACHPERFCQGWYREEDFSDSHGIQWEIVAADHDLFGDGAVTALYLPGHSPGSLALRVRLPSRTMLLTGDVVHTRDDLAREAAYVGDVDSLTARASLRRLRHLAEVEGDAIWIAHDPDDWEAYGGAGEKR
jgi:N-acyl homoserine lactone hydrolase